MRILFSFFFLRCSNRVRDKLHSTISADWPITIDLAGRKPNVPRRGAFYPEKPTQMKELEDAAAGADPGRDQRRMSGTGALARASLRRRSGAAHVMPLWPVPAGPDPHDPADEAR
jgi:hypothetical protein